MVLVVTHSLSYLDVCDQVLLLAPGGKTAFCGPPSQIGPTMGTTNWADIFSSVARDPDTAHQRYVAQTGPTPPQPPSQTPGDLGKPTKTSVRRQFSTIAGLVPVPGGDTAVSTLGMSGALVAIGVPEAVAAAAVLTNTVVSGYLPAIPGWFATNYLVRHDQL